MINLDRGIYLITKTDILKVFLVLPLVFIRKISMILSDINIDMPIAELFLQNMFSGSPSRIETNVVMVMFGMVEIVVFNLLFGMYIYRDLYENCIYIFTRQRSRTRWFINRSVQLLLFCLLYVFLFVGITFLLSAIHSDYSIDLMAVKIVILTTILVTLFTYWVTVVVNLVAIKTGSTIAFLSCNIVLTILSALAVAHEKIPVIKNLSLLLFINPVANVTINWNANLGDNLMNIIYFLVLITLTLGIGAYLISSMDISLENKENNG